MSMSIVNWVGLRIGLIVFESMISEQMESRILDHVVQV